MPPLLRLARLDRPVGIWLLFLPAAAGAVLASSHLTWELARVVALLLVGSVAMRSAGCIWNDVLDRDIDRLVERIRNRPVAAGEVEVGEALAFMIMLCLVGLAVLLQLNEPAIWWGVGSLALVGVYPLAKRILPAPQVVLGLAFNWGALVGYAAVAGGVELQAWLLFAGCLFWTVGYDTIYAVQDARDDAALSAGSLAVTAGRHVRAVVAACYGAAGAFWLVVLGWGALPAVLHLAWQVWTVELGDSASCARIFRANVWTGVLLVAAALLPISF